MKQQRNITLDKEVNNELKARPHINVSALINMLLKEYLEEMKKHELLIKTEKFQSS